MTGRLLVVALLGAISPVVGTAATLTGQVTAEGAPVPNAWVQLNTGLVVVTDARGRYSFGPLTPATYALQVFAPGKAPAVLGEVVPGRGRADVALSPSAAPVGLVHVKATTPAGALSPARLVTRWRAAAEAEWQTPADLQATSTLDGRGRPLVPAEEERPFIVPFGACLWTRGEAVLALPPGQAALTCTAGVLRRVDQQTVEVKPNEVTEVSVAILLGSELGGAGWTGGALGWGVGAGEGYLVNLPLAATVARAEGHDWVSLDGPHGNDPAQGNPKQAAAEAGDERFAVWPAPALPPNPWGGRLVAVGQEQPVPAGVPDSYAAGLLKRAVVVHADPLAPNRAHEFGYGLLVDPASAPLMAVRPASPEADRYVRLWMLLADARRLGCVAVGRPGLNEGRLPALERTFVQTNGSLDQAALVDALRRGATFATTGPALSLTIGDVGPGGVLAADDVTRVAELDAVLGGVPGAGLARLELVRSGQVVRTWDVADVGPNHVQARIAIRERAPAWYVLRAFGSHPSRAAYTSPIYFADPSAPPPAAREARFSGTVVDAATRQPVSAAKVTATAPGGRPLAATTDAGGRYTVTAPVTAMLEASHPRYVSQPAAGADPAARSAASAKFAAWDCPSIREVLETAGPEALATPEFRARLEKALAAPVIDFRLTPR